MTVMPNVAWKRLGIGAVEAGPVLACIFAAGEAGKTRLAASAMRAWPERFGKTAVYMALDPESGSLGSVLHEDRKNLEVIGFDFKQDLFKQMKEVYTYDWRKEGITTVITDTMTVASQIMLSQITNSGKFSERHIELATGINQPMQGDFLAVGTLLHNLLRYQQASGLNHLTLFHEQEVRPEPGQPGEPIGGPATVGKAQVRSIVNWYNTVLHINKRQKKRSNLQEPISYERVVHTTGHGIWQAKLRTPTATNPIPEIAMETDPANVWLKLRSIEQEQN